MTLQTIDIPGLPEGWKAVAYRYPVYGVDTVLKEGKVQPCEYLPIREFLIVEKIQPRRIVLEETDEDNVMDGRYYKDQVFMSGKVLIVSQPKIWKEIEE